MPLSVASLISTKKNLRRKIKHRYHEKMTAPIVVISILLPGLSTLAADDHVDDVLTHLRSPSMRTRIDVIKDLGEKEIDDSIYRELWKLIVTTPESPKLVHERDESLVDPFVFRLHTLKVLESTPDRLTAEVEALLIGALQDSEIRISTLEVIAHFAPKYVGTIPSIIGIMQGSDSEPFYFASKALRQFGEIASDAIPALEQIALDQNHPASSSALEALVDIGMPTQIYLHLVAIFEHENFDPLGPGSAVERMVRKTNPRVNGPDDIKALVIALSKSKRSQRDLVRVLASAGTGAVQPLEALQRSGLPDARRAAVYVLAEILESQEALEMLVVRAVVDPDLSVQQAGIEALQVVDDENFVEKVLRHCWNKEPNRRTVRELLLTYPKRSEVFLPLIAKGLDDHDFATRIGALAAKSKHDPTDKTSFEALINRLTEANEEEQLVILDALGALGEDAKAALPAIRLLQSQPTNELNEFFIEQAIESLGGEESVRYTPNVGRYRK